MITLYIAWPNEKTTIECFDSMTVARRRRTYLHDLAHAEGTRVVTWLAD